ncbi:hypothetical protein K488DRAFT_88863 [Vararia minispora EC-137]|uniref:Uncharacterized protein n=1 Tax=Vararia minispora EC-137 TaxID=1314806 RepID=A0ACB8QCJ4_9AGAM|nr:hypothetical protein K488DRAFT_88863 [Vararia minispora EC-137]
MSWPDRNMTRALAPIPSAESPSLLTSLISIPLEILFEILGHLDPYDLLQLSRSTKAFYRLLSSRACALLWRYVFSNPEDCDAPPRPDDVTGFGWASLVFGGPICQRCGIVSAMSVHILYALRTRLCDTCIAKAVPDEYLPLSALVPLLEPIGVTTLGRLIDLSTRSLRTAMINPLDESSWAVITRVDDARMLVAELEGICAGLDTVAERGMAVEKRFKEREETWGLYCKVCTTALSSRVRR